MGLKNNCYATIWSIDKDNLIKMSDKYADIKVSISKKKKDNTYETDFSGNIRCIGKAFQRIKDLKIKEKDRLQLLEVEITNKYDSVAKKTYTSFICWDLQAVDSDKKTVNDIEIVSPLEDTNKIIDDDLPF